MAQKEIDLDEWELIPDDGFLGSRDDVQKKILYRKWSGSDQKGVFNNYFDYQLSNNSQKERENPGNRATPQRVPSQLVPVPVHIPIQLNPTTTHVKTPDDDDEPVKEITKVVPIEADQDSVSKVFFKKMKENELFVDMKMDSPKSPTATTTARGFMPQIDATAAFNFDDKVEAMVEKNMSSPRMVNVKNSTSDMELEADINSDDGLNLWKLSLTGIGAICSFGIAAATICILFFGSHQKNKHHQQNQKIRFQIYNDDKRFKQVVHQTTKLNEAMSAVRGLPLTRAHVTYGGYYEGL